MPATAISDLLTSSLKKENHVELSAFLPLEKISETLSHSLFDSGSGIKISETEKLYITQIQREDRSGKLFLFTGILKSPNEELDVEAFFNYKEYTGYIRLKKKQK